MDRIALILDAIGASIGAVVGYLVGDISPLLIALIAIMVLDYITGVMYAFKNARINSSIGFIGLLKKVLILLIVLLASIIDVYVIGGGNVCKSATTLFYISNESISVLENVGNLGVKLPSKLRFILEQIEKKSEESEVDNE